VAPATHDTGSAVVAVPTRKTGSSNWAYISSGTWSLMGLEIPKANISKRALELNVTNEGGVDGTYRLLKNIMGLWLVQQCRASFERQGRSYDYATLTQLAGEAPAFRSIIDPDDGRFLSPDDMPSAIASWCRETGQPEPETDGQMVRCCLEALALKYRQVLRWMEELEATKVEVVHIVGGGTKNELLNQFTANACGCSVVAGPDEGTGIGNILIQARTAGEIGSLDDIRQVVRTSSELKNYEPADGDAWDAAAAKLDEFRSQLSQ
jgi:rhamnulokinase